MNMDEDKTGKASPKAFRFDGGAFLFACVITFCVTASTHIYIARYVLDMRSQAAMAWTTPQVAGILVLVAVVTFLLAYVLAHLLFGGYDRALGRRGSADSSTPTAYRQTLHHYFWRFLLIIVICWLPWLVAHLPGAFDDDTVWQLVIWRLPEIWNDHHPFFTTVLFGAFLDLGRALGSQAWGLVIFSAIQVLLTAASFSCLFCYLKRFSMPKWLFVACFVLVCILPPFASYAGEMVKESVFCWPWLLFCILFVEAVRTRGAVLQRPLVVVAMIAFALLMALSKKTGIYLACLPLCVLVFIVHGAKCRGKVALVLAVPIVCLMLWQVVLLPAWGVQSGETIERYAIPLQQTARCVTVCGDDVSVEERETIDAVVPYDELSGLYDPIQADRVKEQNRRPSDEQLNAYLKVWVSMGFRHPLVYLEAACDNSMELYNPLFAIDTKNDMSEWFLNDTGTSFAGFYRDAVIEQGHEAGDTRSDDEIFDDFVSSNTEGLVSSPALSGFRGVMNGYEWVVEHSPLLLVDSFTFMVIWVPLSMLCFGLRKKVRPKRFAFCLVPSLVLYLTLIVSPVIISRYCIVAAFIFPLVLGLPFVFDCGTCGDTDT